MDQIDHNSSMIRPSRKPNETILKVKYLGKPVLAFVDVILRWTVSVGPQ